MQTETQLNQIMSDQKLTKSIARNTLYGFITNFTAIGTRLITIPIIISHIGLDGYGIWSIIVTASAYMRFGTVGVKCAFQKYVADSTGNRDFVATSRLLSTGCALLLFFSIIGLIPMALYSDSIARFVGVPSQFVFVTGKAIGMLALLIVITNAGSVYEAIIMGGHRIDLVRKANIIFSVIEATFIIGLLQLGGGLFALACVMGISEVSFVGWCYFVSKKVVPDIKVTPRYITINVFKELVLYAGSYQLVSVLQIAYGALLPIIILSKFGAEAVGVYTLGCRLVQPVGMMGSSLFVPVLSGAAMVYASGAVERMNFLLRMSFKATLLLSVPLLVFVSIFGGTIVLAWTGTTNALLPIVLTWVPLSTLFGTFSVFALVIYRVAGKTIVDNVREVTRILMLMIVLMFAHPLGLYGVLAGLAVGELMGLSIMFFALSKMFEAFQLRFLMPEIYRVVTMTVMVIGAGCIVSYLPLPPSLSERAVAVIRLAAICITCAAVAWPSALITGAVSRADLNIILSNLSRK